MMRRAAQVGLVAGRGTDFPVRGRESSNPSAEMGGGRFYGQEDFPENPPFVCGSARRALSSEARWVGGVDQRGCRNPLLRSAVP